MKNIDEQKLIDYLQGRLHSEDVAEVEAWYSISDTNAKHLEQLSDVLMLERALETIYKNDVNESYLKFRAHMEQARTMKIRRKRKLSGVRLNKIAVAAVLLVTVALSAMLSIYVVGGTKNPVVVRTNIGERTLVELPDGSRLWLNACSEMKYGSSVFPRERKIELTGEAYFEVAKDSRYFVVNCDGVDIKVLGTKFNVTSNSNERIFTVTLFEGSIQVVSPFVKQENGIIMTGKDQLVINRLTGNTTITNRKDTDLSVSWINGIINFEGCTFEQIARTLERNYNIEIAFMDDKIKQRKFTCDFSTYDNIYRIMSILGMTEKFDYRINGRKIEIKSR